MNGVCQFKSVPNIVEYDFWCGNEHQTAACFAEVCRPTISCCLLLLQLDIHLDDRKGAVVLKLPRLPKAGVMASCESMKTTELKAEAALAGIDGNNRQDILTQVAKLRQSTASSSTSIPSSAASQPNSSRVLFSLPSLRCIGLQSPDEKDDDEELLKIRRPAHPRTNSRTLLLLHDRFHGQAHQHCEHRSSDWIAQLKLVNTSIQEQNNRVRQRWNSCLTQMQPTIFMFLLRLLTHLRNYDLSLAKLKEFKSNAGKHLSVGTTFWCYHLYAHFWL